MIIIPDAMRRPAEVERDELKKQLVSAIHTTAESVEYYYALYANTLFLAKAFTELTQALNNFPKD